MAKRSLGLIDVWNVKNVSRQSDSFVLEFSSAARKVKVKLPYWLVPDIIISLKQPLKEQLAEMRDILERSNVE